MRQLFGRRAVARVTSYLAGILAASVMIAGPAGAAQGDQLPNAGAGAPLIALLASLFVVIVGTTVLLAARRASRDDEGT